MFGIETTIGFAAAFCTALANLPQVIKVWRTHSTDDLSLKMLLLLATGLAFWIAYGLLRGDPVIVLANSVSLLLVANLLVFKLKELWGGRRARWVAPSER